MAMEKTFNAAEAESRLYAAWEKAGCFSAGANAKPGASSFCIMIPPPNVTGVLHMGHAFNNTLQDILIRWKRMQGYDTLWQPGQDHAGIATQMVVERELAKAQLPSRAELGRDAFLEKVWEWKAQSGGTIVEQLKRLGASCDWSRNAFTMSGAEGAPAGEDGNFHDAVIKVFVEMYRKGLIYRGKRLVNWDPHFETAISDLEVENVEVNGHMWHFKYRLADGETYDYVEKDEDGKVVLRETRDYISIATTRPETMLGDGAVAVHPDDERYAPIVGKMVHLPLCDRLIPIITDSYPDPDFGSGAVKITGAHDFNDYQVAKRGKLPMYRLMDTKGAMRDDGLPYEEAVKRAREIAAGSETSEIEVDTLNLVPEKYRGMDRFDARKAVIEDINDADLAVTVLDEEGQEVPFVESKPIMQPFGDRSKVVIEPMLTDQWFVETDKIVGPALDKVRDGSVKILPESGEKTYYHWLENIEPWCISRQLWWGHQIPVWYGLDLSAPDFKDDEGDGDLDLVEMGRLLNAGGMLHAGDVHHCAADFAGVVEKFNDDNADIPAPLNHASVIEVADKNAAVHALAESLAQYAVDQDPTKLVYPVWRDPDVLDTWFSSGLWPIGTLGWPEQTEALQRYFPTNVLITGQDILFFWVARMMMMQLAVVDEIPFDTVYLHGLVRDAKGKKMSKSTGNVVDPLDIIDEYGADALRFTNATMASLGGVLKLDMQRIAGYRNFGTKIWNATRFAEMNGVYEAGAPVAEVPAATATVNKWIIGEVAKVREEVDAALEAYRFNDAAQALYAFVWGKVCDWYVEFSKPLLQGEENADKAETQKVMGWVLDQCLILLHPIMPFITEELWGATGDRAKMLVHADWPGYKSADLVDAAADREMNWVISLIEEVRSARAQMHVPAGLHVPMLVSALDDAGKAAWARNEVLIKRLARIDSLTEVAEFPKGCITVAVEGGSFGLPLADIIDIGEEKARLEKTLGKLGKELGGLRGRLNNPNFAASAPEDVVEETRANLAAREEEEAKLKAALARLAELG
ncbi:Valine--tRNA ligase [Thalassovita gelatinovora]|uniref:Valine--tRNA ligase n=1 Tax=Thalassovita gelatinovora TaxID=53501 RepID=A0A0P1F746_THAGE|nr:valine--tRNA ligase [Thalassovita gelatinovora]QIZ82269.1 valine--tRNA ligase [Thalassovita gelatinovora]CUH63815.1 Valine--tRNA ligase [Thalassovita gelatinovora]SEQ97274.1 valyl-tRNA synthetase [Thalassovita gelatinovora]